MEFTWRTGARALALCAVVLAAGPIHADDDDDAAPPAAPGGLPSLNAEQQRAVGIVVARPVVAKAPDRVQSFGEVLDPAALISDVGGVASGAAAEHAASAEASRLKSLYQGGAGASLKMLEASEAEQTRSRAEAEAAAARFAQRWGPLAELGSGERQKLIDRVTAGRSLLLRAELPGRHAVGTVPEKALLEVDGVLVPGKVLGILRQTSDAQSSGFLVEAAHAPAGLGAGARIPVTLLSGGQRGVALPGDAVLYDESGAYVYKRLAPGPDPKLTRYGPVKVKLLVRYGNGWLVDGVDDDDDIVVHGAGVLWSLQGMGGEHPADDDD